MAKHCNVTLADAIESYKLGDLTVKGLLRFYSETHPKTDWTLKKNREKICEQLGISRTGFYKALSDIGLGTLRMRFKTVVPTFSEPVSEKFDPDFECWNISTYHAGQRGYLMTVIDTLFEQTNASDYYSKSQVIDVCLKSGYFGYSNYAIYYFPQTNKSSLDLAKN